jgi:Ufm1-specific protease 1
MLKIKTGQAIQVPSIKKIQEILVKIGDKEQTFIDSREWIGGFETCYVIDELFQISCILLHIPSHEKLSSKKTELINYFKNQGGLIAMGGDQDAGSKLVAGVNISTAGELSLLIVVGIG